MEDLERRLTDLRRMLDADAEGTGLLDEGLGHATLSALAGEPEVAADRSGTRIDDYRLEHMLGRGGMGEVYLATRMAQGFEQRVALKLMSPALLARRPGCCRIWRPPR